VTLVKGTAVRELRRFLFKYQTITIVTPKFRGAFTSGRERTLVSSGLGFLGNTLRRTNLSWNLHPVPSNDSPKSSIRFKANCIFLLSE